MSLARTILALLIAASVAMLPTGEGFGFKLKSHGPIDTSVVEAMHDCCPSGAASCDKAPDDCGSMAACATKCFGYAASAPTAPVYLLTRAGVLPLFESEHLRALTGSPPFRPPRV